MLQIKETSFESNCIFGWLNTNLDMRLTGYTYMAFKKNSDGKIIWACSIFEDKHEIFVDHYSTNPRWFNRSLINGLFKFCFSKKDRISALVCATNYRSLKLLYGLGFKKEGTIRRSFDGVNDTVFLGLLKEDWQQSKFYKE